MKRIGLILLIGLSVTACAKRTTSTSHEPDVTVKVNIDSYAQTCTYSVTE